MPSEFRIRPQPGFSIARITELGKPIKFSEETVSLKAGHTYKVTFARG
ncbi:MAG: hypothetical protein NTU88_12245 [Armatimonadetes bacterium]|nr:hypothetical protein [Armatimonadota bacterium]